MNGTYCQIIFGLSQKITHMLPGVIINQNFVLQVTLVEYRCEIERDVLIEHYVSGSIRYSVVYEQYGAVLNPY